MNNDLESNPFLQAFALVESNPVIDTERRLKYNVETGEYKIEDANTVPVNEVWEEDYIIISQDTALHNTIDHRIIDGKITWIDTSVQTHWQDPPPALVLENNPYFCIRELPDESS